MGCRGSECLEVMITLHGSSVSLLRCVGGCVLLEGRILVRDSLKDPLLSFLEPL